ncbi:MAG TPA: methyltransferase domain-containing protein, partial [Solirubrobacterales bacterium]|nr:methyltransferase domain-containing protein [Solirubrobacterales bacterium]
EELPEAAVVATDTSPDALEVARANATRLGLADRVRFEDGTVPADESFDLVLANLPYVAERDWAGLAPEVTHWEPREALLAGPDGLDAYRALLIPECVRTSDRYPTITANAQAVAVEIGQGQAAEVAELVRGAGFPRVEVREDLAGTPRVVVGER